MQMEERLRELLNLSIDIPDEGISNVNFKALRQLLEGLVQSLGTDIGTAAGGKAHDDRDVDESLLDKKGSEISEQQNTELGPSVSGTTEEEGLSKCMRQIQSLFKKNQELDEETNYLKKETETLKNQFSQVYGSKSLGEELDKSTETAIQSRDSITGSEQQPDPQTADLRNAVQQLFKMVLNVQQDIQALRMKQKEISGKKMQDKETKDNDIGTGLSDCDSSTAVSDEAPSQLSSGVGHHPKTPASFLDVGHLQEMHKSLTAHVEQMGGGREHILEQINQLKTELVKTIMADINKVFETEFLVKSPESSKLSEDLDNTTVTAIQSKDSISGTQQQHLQTADNGNAVLKLNKELQNVKQELLALRMEQKRMFEKEMQDKELKDSGIGTGLSDTSAKINVPPTSRDSSTAVSDEAPSQVSSGVHQYPETPASLLDVRHLEEMLKSLKAHVALLEEEKKNIQDQMNQLKTQLEMIMSVASRKKISEMESMVMNPESLELGGELEKSAEMAIQSKDSTSGSEQQHDLQIADLWNAVQKLFKAVQNLNQELQDLKIEQRGTSEYIKSKELKDSVKINVPPTSSDSFTDVSGEASSMQYTETPVGHLQAMHQSLKSYVEHLDGEKNLILEEVNQLKTQVMEIVMANTKKIYKTEPQVMGPESLELGGELDKSAIKSKGSISGTEQQHDLETADLRNAVQQLYKEMQDMNKELLALRMEQKRISEKEMQDETNVQEAIQKLQAEFEKLHSTTSQQTKSNVEEQSHIDLLYKAINVLEEKSEEEIKITQGTKADMLTLETAMQQLNSMHQDLQSNTTGLEENYHMVINKIFKELKLNHTGIDHLQKQMGNLQKAKTSESDNAAIVKKQLLTRFHCLSCDRPVNLTTPGPHIPIVHSMPSFPLRHHRKCNNLSQSEWSSTETISKQTTEGDFNGQGISQHHKEYQNTTDESVEMTTVSLKEGTSSFKKDKKRIPEDSVTQSLQSQQQVSSVSPAKENLNVPGPLKEGHCEHNLNHDQLPTSVASKKSRQISPHTQQPSENDLICIGTSCLKKEKQWIPENSLPRT